MGELAHGPGPMTTRGSLGLPRPQEVEVVLVAVGHDLAIELFDDVFPGLRGSGRDEREQVQIARAPGRVNLIGEHTDYSGGFVLPVAIDRDIVIAFRPRLDGTVRLYSADYQECSEFSIDRCVAIESDPVHLWSNYFRGVAWALRARTEASGGPLLRGLDAVIAGDIPRGAGLSSSAALEVASAFALLSAAGVSHDTLGPEQVAVRRDIARVCQKAENEFVGVRCGIMDQIASVMGRAGHAVFLSCSNLRHELVPVALEEMGVALVVYDTGVRRGLGESRYNDRRGEAEHGEALIAQGLGCADACKLSSVSLEQFEQVSHVLPASIARRCEHVIRENERVVRAVAALKGGDLSAFGQLMYESHESLRDLYEVSCPELDAAVEIARGTPGVFGARMTGAGFGGCTINLVNRDRVELLQSRLSEIRSASPSGALMSFVVVIGDGARVCRVGRPSEDSDSLRREGRLTGNCEQLSK